MKVHLTRRALADLNDIATAIRAHHPTAALRVGEELQRALDLLAVYPRAGRLLDGRRRRFAIGRFPYLIYYRIDDVAQVVEVTTIRHGARAPEKQ